MCLALAPENDGWTTVLPRRSAKAATWCSLEL
jgi:hypothetical protein